VTSYSRPLKGFWWVVALTFILGLALAVTSAYKVDFATIPPKLTERELPTYTAGTQLEVTSQQQPYYRTSVDVPVIVPTPTQTTTGPNTTARPATEPQVPEVQTLIVAANYYPYLIECDACTNLR